MKRKVLEGTLHFFFTRFYVNQDGNNIDLWLLLKQGLATLKGQCVRFNDFDLGLNIIRQEDSRKRLVHFETTDTWMILDDDPENEPTPNYYVQLCRRIERLNGRQVKVIVEQGEKVTVSADIGEIIHYLPILNGSSQLLTEQSHRIFCCSNKGTCIFSMMEDKKDFPFSCVKFTVAGKIRLRLMENKQLFGFIGTCQREEPKSAVNQ